MVPALLVIKNCAIGISAINFMLSARFTNRLTLVTSYVTQSSYDSKDLMLMNKLSLGEELVTCLICLFQIQTYDSKDLMLMHKLPLGDELVTWSKYLFQIQTYDCKDLMLMHKLPLGEELVTRSICLFQIQTYDSKDLMLIQNFLWVKK